MHSVNENIVNIKAKILEQAQNLIKYVEDSYEMGLAAHQVEEDLLKQLLQMGYQGMSLLFQH